MRHFAFTIAVMLFAFLPAHADDCHGLVAWRLIDTNGKIEIELSKTSEILSSDVTEVILPTTLDWSCRATFEKVLVAKEADPLYQDLKKSKDDRFKKAMEEMTDDIAYTTKLYCSKVESPTHDGVGVTAKVLKSQLAFPNGTHTEIHPLDLPSVKDRKIFRISVAAFCDS